MHFIKEAAKYARTYQKGGKTPDVRIAILGSASIQHFVMALRYALSREGIHAEIYEGGYDGIAMDVFDTQSPLYCFQPEIVVLLTHYLDIRQFPEILEEAEETKRRLERVTGFYETIWGFLKLPEGDPEGWQASKLSQVFKSQGARVAFCAFCTALIGIFVVLNVLNFSKVVAIFVGVYFAAALIVCFGFGDKLLAGAQRAAAGDEG